MEMTITRSLAELKLLNDRINRKITEITFLAGNKKSNKKVNNMSTKEEFITNVKSDYQSINDLIERRKKIKSAIVDSNAKTTVNISGKQMTVAEAIERKESIQYELALLETMSKQYNSVLALVNRQNELVQQNLDSLLNTMLGKDAKSKPEDEVKAISEPYLDQNMYEIIDPLCIQKEIEKLKKGTEDFLSEVDFVLSESNCISKITIPD